MTEKEIEQKLIEYDNLIWTQARRYFLDGYDLEDIYQELRMEFVKALRNYDEEKGASFTTLFHKYCMSWIERKIKSQNRNKRPKLQFTLDKIVLESENSRNNDKIYIDNILSHYSQTPEEIERYESLIAFINEFIKRNKGGYIIQEMLLNGKGYTEVAKERGTTPQCECQKYIRYLNKLKKELKENGYIDKNIDTD